MSRIISGVFSDHDRVLIDAATIQSRISEMAGQINRDYAGQEITLLAIMDGGLLFVADLMRQLELPVRLVTMSASSYHGSTKSSGQVRLPWPEGLVLKGGNVLLLDDILDTGLTLGALQDRLQSEETASLRTGVLLKKRREHARQVAVDYVGFEIEDEFVVGYGMDYQGRFRNLPCIGILRP